MAVYFSPNFAEGAGAEHGQFQSSLLKATISGHIWDARVQATVDSKVVDVDVDNGVAVKMGGFTGDGLQERTATIATAKDKIGVIGSVPLVKDAYNEAQAAEDKFYNKAGQLSKVYEVIGDAFDPDIFAVSSYLFSSDATLLKKDNYVTVDGNGGYVAVATKPSATAYGFIGQIHSIATNGFFTIVRIAVLQNEDKN